MSDGQQYVMAFNTDGTGTLQSGSEVSSFRWSVNDNTLTMDGGGTQHLCQIAVTKETLTMTNKTMQTPVIWYRLSVQNVTGLIGNWKNPESSVRFNKDGIAILGGYKYNYFVNGNIITLTGYDGSILIPYALNGDVLNLTINGKSITFNRSLP